MRKTIILLILLIALFTAGTVNAADITSHFGWRVHPVTGQWRFHTGIDLGFEEGTAVKAVLPGKVVYSAWYGDYGKTIILDHENGNHTLYAHCSELYAAYGTYVGTNTIIAAVGNTGVSTGPHLHFEYWKQGEYADPLPLIEYL